MRAEIVAIGTELLLGQVTDTNSAWMAEQLAVSGIDCLYQSRVGDNLERIVEVVHLALGRADAVITCGGLGPTQDDITREALAAVMGTQLERDPDAEQMVVDHFRSRGRPMSENNLRQAEVPKGASLITQVLGSAPGLICPVGDKVVYSLPGVPHEMREMFSRSVLPDLVQRAGVPTTIRSRTLRVFGLAESLVAERVAPRLDILDREGPGAPTIAFLASGIEGVKVRVTVKERSAERAGVRLDLEERELRALLGDVVFGVDGETIESAVGRLLLARGLSLGVAESLTGGYIASRIVSTPGASQWFRGAVVAYDPEVKFQLLAVPAGPVVTESAARAMVEGACRSLGCDVGISTTGVAGPDESEGQPVGTCFIGLVVPGRATEVLARSFRGDRDRIRELVALEALGTLWTRLRDAKSQGS